MNGWAGSPSPLSSRRSSSFEFTVRPIDNRTLRAALRLLPALLAASLGCSGIGTSIDRLPDDAAARGYVLLPKPVTLPRGRLTAECVPESVCAVMNYWGKAASVEELAFYGRTPNMNG